MANINQHQAVVLDIANRVDQLITNIKNAGARFTSHITKLCGMVENYGQTLQPYAKKLKRASKQMEQKGIKHITLAEFCPPPIGWVSIDYADNLFVKIDTSLIYRPSNPVNPLLWFGIFGNASLQRPPTEKEKTMCQYVLLAVIHDWELRYSGTPLDRQIFSADYGGKWFKRNEFREKVGKYYHYGYQSPSLLFHSATAQEKLSQLNRALEHVQANLARKKITETQQIEPQKKGERKRKDKNSANTKKLKEYIDYLPKRLEKLVNTPGKKARLEAAKNQLEKDCEDFDRWAMKRDPLSLEYAQKCEEVYQKEMPRYVRWARQYYYILDGILETPITETPALNDRERTLAAYYAVLSLCEIAKNEAFLNENVDGDNNLLVEMDFIKKGYATDIITRIEEAFHIIEGYLEEVESETEKPTESLAINTQPAKKAPKIEREIEPIDTEGLWKTSSLEDLIKIDCNANGIPGNKVKLKRLKEYLRKRRRRDDIAQTLYYDPNDRRIKTKLPVRSIFKQK